MGDTRWTDERVDDLRDWVRSLSEDMDQVNTHLVEIRQEFAAERVARAEARAAERRDDADRRAAERSARRRDFAVFATPVTVTLLGLIVAVLFGAQPPT